MCYFNHWPGDIRTKIENWECQISVACTHVHPAPFVYPHIWSDHVIMLIATGTAQGSQRWVRLGLRHTVSTLEGKVISRGAADRGLVSSLGAQGAHHLLAFYQFQHLKTY